MKKLFILFVALISSGCLLAQPCLPDGISFHFQSQIDSFQINYPNCTRIEGYVAIGCEYNNDITSLAGLDVLTSIGGSLIIGEEGAGNSGAPYIINLEGLEGLDSIYGGLFIIATTSLTDISALDGLNYIGGSLSIRGNDSLATCQSEGLCNYLVNPNGAVTIYNNAPGCNSVVDLGAMCNVPIPCLPYGNYHLLEQSDIDNFQNVFQGCTELQGLLNIAPFGPEGKNSPNSNKGLTISNLGGLSVITSIGGEMWIHSNDSLESLSGLDNIDENSITSLAIWGNPLLSECEVLSVCNYLALSGAQQTISSNAYGCNNKWQVLNACESLIVDEKYLQENIKIFPNPANKVLNISIEGFSINEILIYTLTGQQIFRESSQSSTIDISLLKPGMYIVEVRVEGRKIRQKLLVQR
jgi:hypothetical protein